MMMQAMTVLLAMVGATSAMAAAAQGKSVPVQTMVHAIARAAVSIYPQHHTSMESISPDDVAMLFKEYARQEDVGP